MNRRDIGCLEGIENQEARTDRGDKRKTEDCESGMERRTKCKGGANEQRQVGGKRRSASMVHGANKNKNKNENPEGGWRGFVVEGKGEEGRELLSCSFCPPCLASGQTSLTSWPSSFFFSLLAAHVWHLQRIHFTLSQKEGQLPGRVSNRAIGNPKRAARNGRD